MLAFNRRHNVLVIVHISLRSTEAAGRAIIKIDANLGREPPTGF